MYDDQSAFIFMPFASEIDPATRIIVATDPAVEGDPRLHSWLQSIFG